MTRRQFQDFGQQIERRARVAEAYQRDLGPPQFQLGQLFARNQIGLVDQQLVKIAPTLGRHIVPFQHATGAQVGRIQSPDPAQNFGRVVAVVEQRLVDLDRLPQQGQPFLHVGQVLLARLDQIAQRPPTLTIAHQPRQRAIGTHVQRIQFQDRTQGGLGLALSVGLALLDLGNVHEDFLPQRWLLDVSQHPPRSLGQSRQLARLHRQQHQPFAHRRIGRVNLEHPQQRRKGGCRIGQWALVQIGQQLQMPAPLARIRGHRNQRLEHARPFVEALGQLVVRQQPSRHLGNISLPNPTRSEQPLQALDRLGRDGVNLQNLQVRVGGRGRLGQRSLEQAPHAQKNRRPLSVGAQANLMGESLDQTPQVPHRFQNPRQLAHKAQVERLDFASLAQRGRSSTAVAQTLLLHVRDTQQQFGAQGRILQARLACVLQSNQVRPALALGEELEQGILGLVVARHQG